MTEIDPYAVLGVPRTATRAEIAHAYRALARKHHPDAGAEPSPLMARINEAWRIVSDVGRRAAWDRGQTVIQPPMWTAGADAPVVRRPSRPATPPSAHESGLVAVAVVAVTALVVGAIMIGVSIAGQPPPSVDDRPIIATDLMSLRQPNGWSVAIGEADQPVDHRVLAHLTSFDLDPGEACTAFGDACRITADAIPSGGASVIITAWFSGEPPVSDPITRRPYGLDVDEIIGEEPAAFRWESTPTRSIAWWQLSPPGFPDQWIEVHAEMRDYALNRTAALDEIEAMLQTVEFTGTE